MHRAAASVLVVLAACTHPAPTPTPTPAPTAATTTAATTSPPAHAATPAISPPASAPSTPPTRTWEHPIAQLRRILDHAADVSSLVLFHDDDSADSEVIILSGTADSGEHASCLATASETRCIEFAGYGERHLLDVLRKQARPAIAVPTWVPTILDAVKRAPDVTAIQDFLGGAGHVLMVDILDSVYLAVRRDNRWRISEATYSGGKVHVPGYFGSLDLTAATSSPTIGVILSSYVKEGCVRAELVELVVLKVEDDRLVDQGSVVIGRGDWIATDGSKLAPFDSRDPNHFRVQLRPSVEPGGRIRLELDSKHTPKALRKRREVCGVEVDFEEIHDTLKLIGVHELFDLLADHGRREETDELPAPDERQ